MEIEEIKNNPNTTENIEDHIEEKEAIEKQIQNIKYQINTIIEEEKNRIHLINCQELLDQLIDIKDSIKINYEMIEKLNQKNKNDKSQQEFDETIQQEIKQLLQILVKNENNINEYQKKIEKLKNNKNNCDKENKGIEFYQNLINDKNNEILKIHERINLLKNAKDCNNNENDSNCCKIVKEKLVQLITNENDKMIKIDEIYQWQKKIKEKEISNQINNIDKLIDELKKEKNNILPQEIKDKISKIENINNKILDNNTQICLLKKEIKQDPNNEKIKNEIKNLIEKNDKLTDEKNKIINKDNENEKIISQLKENEKKLEQERKRKQELEQQLNNCKDIRKELEEKLKMKVQKIKQLEETININENDKSCNDNETANAILTIPKIKNAIYSITGDNDDNTYCVGKSNKVFKITKNKEIKTIGEIDGNGYAIKYNGLESIFVGSTSGTIYKYDIKEETFTKIKQFAGSIINKIEADNNHNIYIGTWKRGTGKDLPGNGNIYKLEVGNTDFSEVKGTSGVVWSFAVDKNNNIYVGTTQGLFKTNIENTFTKCAVNIPYENHNIHAIRAIVIDKEENIWIGTREGQHLGHIYKWKKGENKFVQIKESSRGEVFTLAIDSKQNIYAGTWHKPGKGYFLQYYNSVNYFGLLNNIPKNLGSIENIFINNKDDIYIGTKIGLDNNNDGRIYKIKKVCM